MRNILKDRRFFVFKAGSVGFVAIALALLCVFSCNNLLVLGGGSLVIAMPGTRAATASRFTIELTGTNGTTQSKTLAGGTTTAQFDDLAPDTYDIIVKGIDEAGAVVLRGSSSATVVAGKTASTTVEFLVEVVNNFDSLRQAMTAGGTVYVVNDITVTESLIINQDVIIRALNKNVTLNLESNVLMFEVGSGGELTLGGGEYMLTVDGNGQTRSTALVQINSGTVDLYGTITNGVNNDSAGGIKVNGSSSTLNMYDGAIVSNCRCSNTWGIGGAIGLESGTMNMYGGSITGNFAQDASAVYVNKDSVFTMSGGTISGNSNDIAINISSSTFKIGGGALISSDDKVSLKNIPVAITIISPLTGGNSVATLTLKDGFSSGTTVLTAGDGVILANEVGKFVLTSGTIKSDGTLQKM